MCRHAAVVADPAHAGHAEMGGDTPFPWRTDGGVHDDLQRQALQALQQAPQEILARFEAVPGKWSLRAAQAVL